MDWLVFLGKIPFILSGIGFALMVAIGTFGIVYMLIRKIRDKINGNG